MKKISTDRLTFCALLAAAYTVLTVATGFMSFGNIQCRVAEALCVLPFFLPVTTWGLFVGCVLANLLGPNGMLDVLLGSLATLASCTCAAALGRGGRGMGRCVAACAMPVVWNGVVIGGMLAWISQPLPSQFPLLVAVYGGEVALGEAIVMFALGLPLMRWLQKGDRLTRFGIGA